MKTAELRKLVRELVTPLLKRHGFVLHKTGCTHWRKVNDIYHLVSIDIPRCVSLRVALSAWVPETKLPQQTFPSTVGMYAYQYLGPDGLDFGNCSWPGEKEEDARASLKQIAELLEKCGIPWLDKIHTREALVEALHPQFRREYLIAQILGKRPS